MSPNISDNPGQLLAIMITKTNRCSFLSEERLDIFERAISSRLPEAYRDFLLRYNGGQPVPSFFWIESRKDGSAVNRFYGLYDARTPFSIDTYANNKELYGIPASLLPIGDDGMGNFICIDLSPEHFGSIYFLDHDRHPFDDANSTVGMTRLASTFSEFLLLLKEDPE